MKKLIFVCSEFKIGGVESSFRNLAIYALDRSGYDMELHLINQKDMLSVDLPSEIKVVTAESRYSEIFCKRTVRDCWDIIQTYGFFVWMKRLYIRFCKSLGINKVSCLGNTIFPHSSKKYCDVCVVLKENDPCLFYALSKIEAKKYISFFHTANYYVRSYAFIYESLKIDHLITVSQGNKDFLISKMPKVSDKISVIHNIINPKEVRDKARQANHVKFDTNIFNLISVGRICQEKGIETIIAAASILHKQKVKFKWHLLGPYDKDYTREIFESEVTRKELTDYFDVIGASNNPYPYILASDVLVNPSLIESYGMAIRESQILGIPVIATKTYGGNELIEDGISGLLIDITDAKELANKIKLLMTDNDLYHRIKCNLESNDYDESESVKKEIDKLISC